MNDVTDWVLQATESEPQEVTLRNSLGISSFGGELGEA